MKCSFVRAKLATIAESRNTFRVLYLTEHNFLTAYFGCEVTSSRT